MPQPIKVIEEISFFFTFFAVFCGGHLDILCLFVGEHEHAKIHT